MVIIKGKNRILPLYCSEFTDMNYGLMEIFWQYTYSIFTNKTENGMQRKGRNTEQFSDIWDG